MASGELDRHRRRFAAADAKGRHTAPCTTRTKGADEGDENARTRCADGVAQGTCAAVRVDPIVREPELAHRGHGHYREGFVDLPQVDLVLRPLRLPQRLAHGTHRSRREPLRLLRVRRVRHDGGERNHAIRIGDRGVPRHVCLHYSDADELWRLFRPFVLEQLRQRAPILYIHEENGRDAVMSRIRSEGYDPEELCNAGLLRLLEPSDGYLRAGTFVPDRMVDFMEAAILAFRASGHQKLLISGEMSWYLKGTPGTERMIEYEALLNKLLARHPEVTIVCHYDTHRMDGAVTLGALCSHTHVQLNDRLVQGFFVE